MIRSLALFTVFGCLLLIGAAYASAFASGGTPAWAPYAMAIGTAGVMSATMALGAVRRGRLGKLWLPIGFVFVVLAGGFAGVLWLPPADPGDPELWLGLPPRAAVVLYGIGLLPLLTVPVTYALTFDEMTLSEEDLARVRGARPTPAEPAAPRTSPRTAEVG